MITKKEYNRKITNNHYWLKRSIAERIKEFKRIKTDISSAINSEYKNWIFSTIYNIRLVLNEDYKNIT